MINDEILPDLDEFLTELDEDDLPPLFPDGDEDLPAADDGTGAEDRGEEDYDPDGDGDEDGPEKHGHVGLFVILVLILALLGGAVWYAYPRYISPMLSGTGAVTEEEAEEEPAAVPSEEPAEESAEEPVEESAAEPAEAEEAAAAPEEPSEPAEEETAPELAVETENEEPAEASAEKTENEEPAEATAGKTDAEPAAGASDEMTDEQPAEEETAEEASGTEEEPAAEEPSAADRLAAAEAAAEGKPHQAAEMFGGLLEEANAELAAEAAAEAESAAETEPEEEPYEEPARPQLTEEEALQQIRETDRLRFLGDIEVCGIACSRLAKILDLTAASYCDLEEIRAAVPYMPKLERIILPQETGYTNEEIDAFNQSLENVRVIWTVWIGYCPLRTDTTYFCKNTSSRGYVGSLETEDYEPLRYCTDLIALDIGHGEYTDISFLEPLVNLRYLILADAYYNDISVLSNLKNLYYLELFLNKIDDISVLGELTNLRYLNIGFVRGFSDYSVLPTMTWLEYLWAPGNRMTSAERAELEAALPDATLYIDPNAEYSSTNHGWRETPGYYEMRDALHMYYMSG